MWIERAHKAKPLLFNSYISNFLPVNSDLIKQKDTSITLSIEHPEYGHSAKIQGKTREALLKDFI